MICSVCRERNVISFFLVQAPRGNTVWKSESFHGEPRKKALHKCDVYKEAVTSWREDGRSHARDADTKHDSPVVFARVDSGVALCDRVVTGEGHIEPEVATGSLLILPR